VLTCRDDPASIRALSEEDPLMPHPHLLLLGDDSTEIRTLSAYLRDTGYTVRSSRSADLLLHEVRRQPGDLLVLDIDIVAAGCQDFCTSFLATSRAPILVLSSTTSRRWAVECLECCAEVYLDKKSPPEIIAANIRALLRRFAPTWDTGGTAGPQHVFDDGHLAIDRGQRRVFVDGRPVHLTRTEYKLLLCFADAPGQLLPYSRLLQFVWEDNEEVQIHHVHTYVARLKRKIVPQRGQSYFENERGVGYRFCPAV
jgi:DNA-binding response OmpR family regulator